MQVKQLQQNVFFSIQVLNTGLVRYMMVLQLWTGWNKNKNVVLQLLQLQQLVNGLVSKLILSILRDTLTLLLKLSVLCVYLMVQYLYSVQSVVFSLSLKQYAVNVTVTRFPQLFSLTSMIEQVQISTK